MNFKKQLEKYLKDSGMSATELSRRSGISRKTLQNWLSGQHPRDFGQLKSLCDVIGCSLDTLIYGDGFETAKTDSKIFDEGTWLSGVFEVKVRRIR